MLRETPAIRQWSMDPEIKWSARKQQPARPQNPKQLADCGKRLERVLEDLRANNGVEMLVRQSLVEFANVADKSRAGRRVDVDRAHFNCSRKKGAGAFVDLRRNVEQPLD